MTGGVLGGGVIFVVAALLWAAVLVPAWTRRREFRAAERNAMRLQRTLRVLAETAEVPQELTIEATAREALAHEKLLRTAQRQQEAERAADLAEARAASVRAEIRAQEMRRRQAAAQRSARLRRPAARRVRALAAAAALVGILGSLVGVGLLLAGSGAGVLICSALIALASAGGLVLLAPGRVRVQPIQAEQVPTTSAAPVIASQAEPVATGETEAAAEAHAAAQRAAAERIERARSLARNRAQDRADQARPQENQPDSMLLREAREQVARDRAGTSASVSPADEAQASPAAAPAPRAQVSAPRAPMSAAEAQRGAAAQRLREMGVIGDTSEGLPDLDAALRRRRSAG